jgi:hypothetical protein
VRIESEPVLSFFWVDALERFRAKWIPVRVKKTRQNKNLEPRSDPIGTEKALALRQPLQPFHFWDGHRGREIA